ncbi:MAG: polyhydroxyalkanoate synthesis repressor PhaR [Proteobacteria bacterium]|nr:MAG: polyhydroxyalkanoate synthesis repressor PhaR [Pseudomonadota bacterium]TDJ73555.1 MAG: polyhydroxyalkanoate synthesis repressor PhaR [Pseudomonadota bacterium]
MGGQCHVAVRIIKKYPNRRLYDTELSHYITLADIRELVLSGSEFRVIEANTEEDLTRSILLQIIIEQESGGEPLFTTEVLTKMIRFYGDNVQQAFTSYLERSLALVAEQQESMQDQMNVLGANPVSAMSEITQRNLKVWADIQESFLKATGTSQAPRQQKAAKESDKT